MRKFTFLFFMLCCFCTSVKAQYFEVSDAPGTDWAANTKWYLMKLGNGSYLSLNTDYVDDAGALKTGVSTKPSKDDEKSLWCIVGNETDGYQFYNKSAGVSQVMGVTGSEASARTKMYDASSLTSDVTATFMRATSYLSGNYDCFRLKGSDNNYFNSRDNYLALWNSAWAVSGWGGSGGDAGSGFKFESIDLISVTYEYYINGALYKSMTQEQEKNSACSAPALDYVTISGYDVESVGETDCTVKVTCSENLPFFVSASDLSTTYWYTWKMHSNQPKAISYSTEEGKMTYADRTSDVTLVNDDANLWCITGNLISGFKLYNKGVGSAQTLSYASGDPVMASAEENNSWSLVKSTANNEWYCFVKPGGGNDKLNLNLTDGCVSYWQNPDAGSSCYFMKPGELLVEQFQSLLSIPEALPTNAVGYPKYLQSDSNKTILTESINTLNADLFNLDNARSACSVSANIESAGYEEVMVGKYYYVYNAYPGLYVKNKGLITSETGNVTWATVEPNNPYHIFTFTERSDGKWAFYACNREAYQQGVAGALNAADNSNGLTLNALGVAQYNLVWSNGTVHANGHGNGSGESGSIINYGGGYGTASAWYIIPANTIEVTLTNVGESNYATAYLPFAVQGSDLYTGEISADKTALTMTAQTNAVPAQTGLVIKSDNPTVTLTICDSADPVSANSLIGSLTPVTENLSNYLVLGKGNTSNSIGFFAPSASLTSIAANKAYLNASDVASGEGSAIALNFGGTSTAILDVVNGTLESNAPVFDLSGRRVMKTVKGSLYIQNGKKFIAR